MAFCQTLVGQVSLPPESGKVASNPGYSGVSPRLTFDHTGFPVLSWVEEDDSSNVVGFYFSRFNVQNNSFEEKKSIRIVKGISSHAEGMPKLAFKNDGTIIAVYETNRPVPDSRFSGDLLYTLSSDNGASWTTPIFVHADTTSGKSRSFSDLCPLPNGEIGIVWLGEKSSKTSGRPLKFAQTQKGGGFGEELIVKQGVCECCRTDLFVDSQGNFHLYFRDILPTGARDIGHLVSRNKGLSFGEYYPVYPDHWIINACPHAGPSTAELQGRLFTAWYTGEENKIGIKVSDEKGSILTHIPSASARHPQLASQENRLILAWDQPMRINSDLILRVNIQLLEEGKKTHFLAVTNEKEMAQYPAILPFKNQLIVAYEDGLDKKMIRYTVMPLPRTE